jgi:hypothetical protein
MNTPQIVSEVPLSASRGQVGSPDAQPAAPGSSAVARARASVRVLKQRRRDWRLSYL